MNAKIKQTKTGWRSHKYLIQFVEYMIGGGVWFWSGYLVFIITYTGLGWNWFWAKMAADVVGWSLNFMLQRYWAFADPRLASAEGRVRTRYLLLTAVNFVIDYAIVGSLNSVGVTPYIGLFVAAAFFTGWNYLWYRLWVFKV